MTGHDHPPYENGTVFSASVDGKDEYWNMEIRSPKLQHINNETFTIKLVNETGDAIYWNGSSLDAYGPFHIANRQSSIDCSTDMEDHKILWRDNNNNSFLDCGDYINIGKPATPGEYEIQVFFNETKVWTRRVEVNCY